MKKKAPISNNLEARKVLKQTVNRLKQGRLNAIFNQLEIEELEELNKAISHAMKAKAEARIKELQQYL